MVKVSVGDRAGRDGRLGVGCSASIFDSSREKTLLVHRMEDGKWAVPGGYMESGESFTEACEREVFEEPGLHVRIRRLISIYTSPHYLLEYPDGNKWQLVCLHFEAEVIGGELRTGDETTGFGYFTLSELDGLDMHRMDRMRVKDGFIGTIEAIIHDDFDL